MDVEATLAMKEARSKMLQMEKEEMIQEVISMFLCNAINKLSIYQTSGVLITKMPPVKVVVSYDR